MLKRRPWKINKIYSLQYPSFREADPRVSVTWVWWLPLPPRQSAQHQPIIFDDPILGNIPFHKVPLHPVRPPGTVPGPPFQFRLVLPSIKRRGKLKSSYTTIWRWDPWMWELLNVEISPILESIIRFVLIFNILNLTVFGFRIRWLLFPFSQVSIFRLQLSFSFRSFNEEEPEWFDNFSDDGYLHHSRVKTKCKKNSHSPVFGEILKVK